jgi:hypothetical protein
LTYKRQWETIRDHERLAETIRDLQRLYETVNMGGSGRGGRGAVAHPIL